MNIEIIQYETITSTQVYAKELLKTHKKRAPFCVTAKSQTGGYGQAGRQYYCPRGGIYMSLVLPEKDFKYKFAAGFVTVCIADIISQNLDERPLSIKWINDIKLGGKKVGGVLIEAVTTTKPKPPQTPEIGTEKFYVIGIGLNLTQTQKMPKELEEKMGFINTAIPSHEFINAIIKKITSAKLTDEQVLYAYKKYCKIDGLNIDGSLNVTVDGKTVRKINNL